MTKKDFVLVAAVLKAESGYDITGDEAILDAFVEAFTLAYPRFNATIFRAAVTG